MAEAMFTATVDAREVLALLDRLGPSVDFVAKEVGRDTAARIVAEAERRVARATGKTESGIHWELTRDGMGYIVMAYRAGNQPDPVDIYLERGTQFMHARPFFFSSAALENQAHLRRLTDRIQQFLEAVGR